MTEKQYWYEFDIDGLNNAISVACFPKEITDWIFEKDMKPFQPYKR